MHVLLLIAIVGIAIVYYNFDLSPEMFPSCPSKSQFNLECGFCGAQRSLNAILNGEITAAFRFNWLFPGLLVVAIIDLVVILTSKNKSQKPTLILNRSLFWKIFGIAFISYSIFRNF